MTQDHPETPNSQPHSTPEATPEIPGPAAAAASLEQQLEAAQAEAAQLKDQYLRALAEVDNTRRRAQDEVTKAHKYAVEKFAENLLSVKDSLEMTLATENVGLETLRDGVDLTLKNLASAFEKAGLKELNPVGEKFDPNRHQAMSMIPSPQPANTVVQVFQKGYLINERVLRPALVAVSQGSGS